MSRQWNRWTEAEDEFLRQNYWEHGATALVKMLPRHPDRQLISWRARQLGLTTRIGPYGRVKGGRHGEA